MVALSADMRDVYAATHGRAARRPPTPDEDVPARPQHHSSLRRRVFCAGLDRLVIGTLAHNPFPDATFEFRSAMAKTLSLGLAHKLDIEAPYAEIGKAEVIRRGLALGVPFELTMSCMKPAIEGAQRVGHCGECSKCRERHDAFVEANVADPTDYESGRFTGR
jgi:7-cyano-7-deazaguanine synthase